MQKTVFRFSCFSFAFLLAVTLFAPTRTEASTAYAVGPVLLFERPERGAKAVEVTFEDGAPVEDMRRTGGERWYEAEVGDKSGWLFGGNLYVSISGTGGEDDEETLSKLSVRYAETRDAMFEGMGPDEKWVRRPDVQYKGDEDNDPGTVMTWASKEAVVQTISTRDQVLDLYFAANTPEAAERFLGFPAVGMTEEELSKKLSSPPNFSNNVWVYPIGDGDTTFEFTFRDGVVVLAEFSFLPGNGMELPRRVFDLQRFRGAPARQWARKAWSKGTNVRVRAEPSANAKIAGQLKESETEVVWFQKRDRGEAHPWYEVEFKAGPGAYKKGWVYGQFVEPPDEEKPTYFRSFWDTVQYEVWEKTDALKKSLGKPRKAGKWDEEWAKFSLHYQEFHGDGAAEKYLAGFKTTDPQRELGGVRVGDGMESLQELADGLLADGWSGEKELKEGDNTFTSPEGNNIVTLTFKDSILAALGCESRAID